MINPIIKNRFLKAFPFHPNVSVITFECNWCKKEFIKKESYFIKQSKRQRKACCFCSRNCKSHWIASIKFLKGDKSPKWKGGKRISTKGYVEIYKPDHPQAIRHIYVYEHRLVMEKHLGRFLKIDELIHHIDRNPLNNSLNNLKVMKQSDHIRLHRRIKNHK